MKAKLMTMALMTLLIVSCGKKDGSPDAVKAEDSNVGGTLGEYVTLKTGDYNIVQSEERASMTVTFEVTAIPSGMEVSSWNLESKLILLDENKNPIGLELELGLDGCHELQTALKNGSKKLSLNYEKRVSDPTLLSKAKYVEASVSGELSESSESSASTSMSMDEVSVSNTSSSSIDIDAWLDKYDRLMDTYVSLAKKAANGDASAMTEYASYMEQVSELANDLNNVSGDMTPAQAARMAKIAAKMSKAAM